jgi:hypothetical protein
MLVDQGTDVHETGELALVGSLACVECGYSLSLEVADELPNCPACGGSRFRRASMFEVPTVDADAISPAPVVVTLRDGWNRIGRSGSADIQLDDATVSRRHALIVRTPDEELRALDDRSLNGLFINGERVEWAPLVDGDELEIGRYRLYVLQG